MPRARYRRQSAENENLERWLLTYADLITLLLAFFIVMYSMSQIDAKKFGKMAQALNGVLRGGDVALQRYLEDPQANGHGLLKLGDLKMLQEYVEKKSEEMGKQEQVVTEITERGLVVHIIESALFDEGSADIRPQAMEVLDVVANKIKDMPNHVRIEGHTDDRDIMTSKYPSNWELSAARATSVVRYLIDHYHILAGTAIGARLRRVRPIRLNNSIENRAEEPSRRHRRPDQGDVDERAVVAAVRAFERSAITLPRDAEIISVCDHIPVASRTLSSHRNHISNQRIRVFWPSLASPLRCSWTR